MGTTSPETLADSLATVFLHADAARNGPLQVEGLVLRSLVDAAAHLGSSAGDPRGNYHRRVAIAELRSLREKQTVDDAFKELLPDVAGKSTYRWEPVGDVTDELDPQAPGARRVAFALRVERRLDQTLRETLDPQAWDDYSPSFMRQVVVVDTSEADNVPPWRDVPETPSPPPKGSRWSTKPPAEQKLFEHFSAPLWVGGAEFLQTLEIAGNLPAPSYGFTYSLDRCRWTKYPFWEGEGGIIRNQGTLEAREQGSWTYISVDKSLMLEARAPYSADTLTRMAVALLKVGWRQELGNAVANGA